MKKKYKRFLKAFLAVFLSISLASLCMGDRAWAYITDFGSTHIIYHEQREIAKGVVLDNWQGKNPDGTPKLGHTITFDPKTSDAMVLAAYGDSVYSRKTLSSLSIGVEKQGMAVIGGINGDFYHLANGVPIGMVIQNGRLVSLSTTAWSAVGFKEDGSVVMGSPKVDMKVIINETEIGIGNFNKAQGDWGPYLYSSDFGPDTGSTVPSYEVILDINMGEIALGKMLIATVSEVRSETKATPIGKNQLVLSAKIGKQGHYALSKIKVGDSALIQFNDLTGQWTDVKQAIGGEKLLIQNGAIAPNLPVRNYNPATAIGTKANGEIVLFEVDGRNDSFSQGVSSQEAAQFLYNLGCVQAIQLDGGGSSTMIARSPGYRSPGVINNPSDGKERANSNGILLISKRSVDIKNGTAQINPVAQKIHIYPSKAYALPGATLQYTALATDEYFFPTTLPQDIVWGTDGGTIDSSGRLTASLTPGLYQVLAGGGQAFGKSELQILDSVTSLKPSKSMLVLSPGDTEDLSCQAYYQDVKVAAGDTSFAWSVEGDIGTITNEGVFTAAANAQGKGRIVVRYGALSAYIDVSFTSAPDSIEDFENGIPWSASKVRAKSGSATVIEDKSLAKSGSKLLRVDYDFTLDEGIEKGVAGVYAFRVDPNTQAQSGIVLEKNPAAIGMWVYGDNSKTWIRARLKDGKGQGFDIDFTPDYRTDTKTGGVDFTGWKYLEAAIPASKTGPFMIETPIRIMCSRDEMRTRGTLYFDNIKVIYGAGTRDSEAPSGTISSPAAGAVLKSGKVAFKAELSDNAGGSGIDPASIQVLLDGAAVTGLTTSASVPVSVQGELGAGQPLADGYHTLVVNFYDAHGNKGSATTSFFVDTGSPQIMASSSQTFYSGGNFTTTLSAKNPKNLKKLYIVLNYNPSQVEPVDADSKAKGKQIALEAWVKKGKVITHSVDDKAGRIVLEIDNLTNLSSGAQSKVGTITFKAKAGLQSAARITSSVGALIVGRNKASQRFSLPAMNVNFDFAFTLKASGMSKGDMTSFTLTDRNGNPVEGAGIYLNANKDPAWLTDKAGKVQTNYLTQLPAGTVITAKAAKGEQISNTVTLKISEANTGLNPQNLNITLAPTPGSVSLNYITPKDQTGTLVQYIEKSAFTGSFSDTGVKAGLGTDIETSLVSLKKTETVRVHSAVLEGLKPGTTYVYRLGDALGRFSSAYELTTPQYDSGYSFLFVTDPQAVDAASYQVFGDIMRRGVEKASGPAFILLGGDLVDNGSNKGQWDMMFNSASQIFASTPVVAAAGNHEYYDDANLVNFKSCFTLPENGPEGYAETAYSFQTKDAIFFVMDTQKPLQKQLEWIEKTCKSTDKKWKIVLMHRGIYSGFYDEAALRKSIAPVFDRAGIDLVLNGHDHTYLRTTMKAGKKVALGAGTTYITGGSSAKKYYDAKKRAWTEVLYDADYPVFTTFRVSSGRISVVSCHIEKGLTKEHDRFDIVK